MSTLTPFLDLIYGLLHGAECIIFTEEMSRMSGQLRNDNQIQGTFDAIYHCVDFQSLPQSDIPATYGGDI